MQGDISGKVRNLLNRNGRYFARLVIPRDLRPFIDNKTELHTPLGPDYRAALRSLPGAVTALQHRIALAERRKAEATGERTTPGRYPLSHGQIALRSYYDRLAQDEDARNTLPGYASVEIDDGFVADLRAAIAGKLNDTALNDLVGHRIEHFARIGNTTATLGSPDWRALARAICIAEYEVLERMVERDEGDYSGVLKAPVLVATKLPEDSVAPISLQGLLADYIAMKRSIGKGESIAKRWVSVFNDLSAFIGHDDASRLTKRDLLAWRDARIKTHAAKTVSDVMLASVRTVLKWAVENDRLPENVAGFVRQEKPKKTWSREKGFTDPEALAMLRASRAYSPANTGNARTTELPTLTAAKRWAPLLCAFTGARIGEVAQLRAEDFRKEGDTFVVRITPDAGTVKTGRYRDVPLDRQLISEGLWDLIEASSGPLFFKAERDDPIAAAQDISGKVSRWLHGLKLVPKGMSPNHARRHRFKTVGHELGASDRVLDAICGHAGKTAGDDYGDITIAARKRVIDMFPAYDLS